MTIRIPSITIRRQTTVYSPRNLGGDYLPMRHVRRTTSAGNDSGLMPLPAAAGIL